LIDTSIVVGGDDPLFGTRVEERFERLLESTKPAQ